MPLAREPLRKISCLDANNAVVLISLKVFIGFLRNLSNHRRERMTGGKALKILSLIGMVFLLSNSPASGKSRFLNGHGRTPSSKTFYKADTRKVGYKATGITDKLMKSGKTTGKIMEMKSKSSKSMFKSK
jgi:hypothetical protein